MRDPERPVSLKKPETAEEWAQWRAASQASAEACGRSHEDCEGCAWKWAVPMVCQGHVLGPVACRERVARGQQHD